MAINISFLSEKLQIVVMSSYLIEYAQFVLGPFIKIIMICVCVQLKINNVMYRILYTRFLKN